MGHLFGTDGVRGIANRELTGELAYRIGRATAAVLASAGGDRPAVVIGADTRASSEMLAAAVAAGLCSAGGDAVWLGVLPTPAVAYLTVHYGACAGIVISASHNSAEYNGIKLFSGKGYKLPDAVEDSIEAHLDAAAALPSPEGSGIGRIRTEPGARRAYLESLKATVPERLDGLRFAVDCANGATACTARTLFCELGAEPTVLFDRPNGTNINRGCGSTHWEALAAAVVERGLPFGLAFDGDGDRLLAVDSRGNLIDGDRLLAICAADLQARGRLHGNAVVSTVMSNFGLSRYCDTHGMRLITTRVGDRYVSEELRAHGYALGGEQSGHLIFNDLATTGDGQLTALQLLAALKRQNTTLDEAAAVMTAYPQWNFSIPADANAKMRFAASDTVRTAIAEAETALRGLGRVVVRPSGTEPIIRIMAQGDDEALVKATAERLTATVRTAIGEK